MDTIKKELATRVSILYYEEKFGQNEVASKLGISRSYVSQLLTYARLNDIVKYR
jgi:DNA-binding transcriptional regulator LsrR (DeoR family)